MKSIYFIYLLLLFIPKQCNAQKQDTMNTNKNPLLCEPKEGVCATPNFTTEKQNIEKQKTTTTQEKPVTIIYYTDPICSSCWGIEPQLRKLKLEYGEYIDIVYCMGGLLPDWSYNSGGISKPSDVAHHWDEVSQHYQMPIDGDVWLENPLHSSYPPSIAFKAAQMQNLNKAIDFLRILRELVFLEKKNITEWQHITKAAQKVDLDVEQLQKDFNGKAKDLFQQDLLQAKQLGVRGFPTLFVRNNKGDISTIYGFRPYSHFEENIKKIYPKAKKKNYAKDWKSLFQKFSTLTTKEFAELSNTSMKESLQKLKKLQQEQKLSAIETKNGYLWFKINFE